MKIIDCFIFYNETGLLKYRLDTLKDVVDYFVIVESTNTFTGNFKELYFDKSFLKEYPIKYLVITNPYTSPENNEVWKNERFQRNNIALGLDQIKIENEDLLIFSDVDELPDPDTLKRLKNEKIKGIFSLEQDNLYLLYLMNDKCYYPKIMDYRTYTILNDSIDNIRCSNRPFIPKGGWHLSYFSHQEHNNMKIENENYLPPNFTLKESFAFHTNHLCERATSVSMYDYAYHLKEKYNIIIFYKTCNEMVIKKFEKYFECYKYQTIQQIQEIVDSKSIKYFYSIRSGEKDFLITNCKNLIHSVFKMDQHGDINASVFKSKLWVPPMINLPKTEGNFRNVLGIPQDAIVIGRYGGFSEFNITYVHNIILNFTGIYFLFANTKNFGESKFIIYLPKIIDLERKSLFINTCDAMIHARNEGETFGLSIAEFSTFNKPIITCRGIINQHLDILGEKAIIYNSPNSLKIILNGIQQIINSKTDWNAYTSFTPKLVMDIFSKIFIHK